VFDDQIMALLQKVPGARSVPQIYIEDKLVGTYDDLMKISDSLIKKTSGGLMEFSETYKPFYYPWAVDLTSRHEKSHWIEDELDLSEDVADWKGNKMTNNEKEYITNILRLFTQSDVAVGQNYYDIFIPRFKNNEVRNMLGSFASREGIHQRAYALLNETLGLPDSEYHAFLEYKEMTDKVDFMMDNDSNTLTGTGLALAKMVFNEGVSLFASFVMLLNFQRFGKMKGMGKVVEWSIRDESMP
jgi:ribonucleoside-diphosphate reductase beta chain